MWPTFWEHLRRSPSPSYSIADIPFLVLAGLLNTLKSPGTTLKKNESRSEWQFRASPQSYVKKHSHTLVFFHCNWSWYPQESGSVILPSVIGITVQLCWKMKSHWRHFTAQPLHAQMLQCWHCSDCTAAVFTRMPQPLQRILTHLEVTYMCTQKQVIDNGNACWGVMAALGQMLYRPHFNSFSLGHLFLHSQSQSTAGRQNSQDVLLGLQSYTFMPCSTLMLKVFSC